MLSSKKRFKFKATTSSSSGWKDFHGALSNSRILIGRLCESGDASKVSSSQCMASAVAAIAYSECVPIKCWTDSSLNVITSYGYQTAGKIDEKETSKFTDFSGLMGIYKFSNGSVQVKELGRRNATTDASNQKFSLLPSASSVMNDFSTDRTNYCCVLNGTAVAKVFQDLKTYLFSNHGFDEFGKVMNSNRPCVIQMDRYIEQTSVEKLLSDLYAPRSEASPATAVNHLYCFVGLSTKSEESASVETHKSNIDSLCEASDSDDDFNLTKTAQTYSQVKPQPSTASKLQGSKKAIFKKLKLDASLPLPAYALAALPEYEFLEQFLGDIDLDRVSSEAISPEDVVDNMLVLYKASSMESKDDYYWRRDGLPWKSGPHQYLPGSSKKWLVMYFYIRTKQGKIWRRRDLVPVRRWQSGAKYDWEALKHDTFPFIIVHYDGIDSIENIKFTPHGNTKSTPQKAANRKIAEVAAGSPTVLTGCSTPVRPNMGYQRKNVRVLNSLKRKLTFNPNTSQAFVAQEMEAQLGTSTQEKQSLRPRNKMQARNAKKALQAERGLEDQETLLVYHSILHKEYLPWYNRKDGFLHCLSRVPQMDHHFEEVLRSSKHVVLSFDTTFEFGPYYLSIFVFRHPWLRGHPAIPLRFLWHETKTLLGHEMVFSDISTTFPRLLNMDAVVITDREAAFKKARKRHMKEMPQFFCYLHIYRSIGVWCDSHGCASRKDEYSDNVRSLLFSRSQSALEERLKEYQDTIWSLKFKQYYLRHLHADVLQSARFNSQNFGIFDEGTGVTTNAIESVNSAYKTYVGEKKGMYEGLLFSYAYVIAKLQAIQDAMEGRAGEYKPLDRAKGFQFTFEPTDEPVKDMALNAIFTKGRVSNLVTEFKPKLSELKTTLGFAHWIKRDSRKRIKFDDEDCFVKGFFRRTFHVDHKRGVCSCLKPLCEHLRAVYMTIDKPLPKKSAKINLSRVVRVYRNNKSLGLKLSDKKRTRHRFQLSRAELNSRIEETRRKYRQQVHINSSSPNPVELPAEISSEGGPPTLEDMDSGNDGCKGTSSRNEMENESFTVVVHDGIPAPTPKPVISTNLTTPQEATAGCRISDLPPLSLVNGDTVLLRISKQELTLVDLKTLDIDISRGELAIIRRKYPHFKRGQLGEAVIDAFCISLGSAEVVSLPSMISSIFLTPYKESTQAKSYKYISEAMKPSCKKVLIPLKLSAMNWCLGTVEIQEKNCFVSVLDSTGTEQAKAILKNMMSTFKKIMCDKYVQEGTSKSTAYKDLNLSSDLLTCLGAYNFAKDTNVVRIQSQGLFSLILNEVRQHCRLMIGKEKSNNCVACKKPLQPKNRSCESETVSCVVCGARRHKKCLTDCKTGWEDFRCGDDRR